MMNKKLTAIISVVVLIIVIFWIRSYMEKKNALSLVLPHETVATVEAEKARFSPMPHKITTIGVLKANRMVTIKPDANGHIEKILFQEGAYVTEGSPLIMLENSSQKAEYLVALAEFNSLKSNFMRTSELLKKNVAAQQTYDKAKADMEVAKAKMDHAKSQLDKRVIKAPFSGYVSLHDISVGAYVTHGQEGLLTVVDSNPMKVEFSISELYLKQLRLNQEVDIFVESYGVYPIKGIIEAIDAKVDPLNHSVTLRSAIQKNIHYLRPGQFATVKIELGNTGNVVQIPDIAIEVRGDQSYVYRVIDNRAVRTRVVLGPREAGYVQVVDGVRAGDWVITAGQVKVRDDERVKVVNGDFPNEEKSEPASEEKTEQTDKINEESSENSEEGAPTSTAEKTAPSSEVSNAPKEEAGKEAEEEKQPNVPLEPNATSQNSKEDVATDKTEEKPTEKEKAKEATTENTTVSSMATNPILLAGNNE